MSYISTNAEYAIPDDAVSRTIQMPLEGIISNTLQVSALDEPSIAFSNVVAYPKGITVDIIVPIGVVGTYDLVFSDPSIDYETISIARLETGLPFDQKGDIEICDFELTTDQIKDVSVVTSGLCDSLSDALDTLQAQANSDIFGDNYEFAIDNTTTITTSPTYQTKLTLNTSSIPSGSYRVSYSCELAGSTTNRSILSRVLLNGITTIAEVEIEPKDSSNFYSFSGFDLQSLAGVNTLELQFARLGGGATISMRRARLEVFRVL